MRTVGRCLAGLVLLAGCQGGTPGEQFAVPAEEDGLLFPEGGVGVLDTDPTFGDDGLDSVGGVVNPGPSAAVCDPASVVDTTFPVTAGAAAAWGRFSPDGRHLVVSGIGVDGKPRLVLMSTCTGAARTLVDDVREADAPVWAPHGRSIYFPASSEPPNGQMYEVGLSDGVLRPLFPIVKASAPDVSPDGERLVFATDDQGLMVYDLAARSGPFALGIHADAPRFAEDGKTLLFIQRQPGVGMIREVELVTGRVRELAVVDSTSGDVSADYVFDDGIVVSSDGGVQWLRDGATPVTLARDPGVVDVSRDGRLLAITRAAGLELIRLRD